MIKKEENRTQKHKDQFSRAVKKTMKIPYWT